MDGVGLAKLAGVKAPPADLADRLWEVADRALQQGSDLRVDELSELTGVPRATLYYYFSGRDDVAAFLLAQQVQRGTERIAEAARTPGTAAERLAAVVRAMLDTMAQHPALCTRLLGGMVSNLSGAQLIAEVDRTIMAPVRELLREAAADGELTVTDPSTTTLALVGAVSTVAMVRTLSGDFDPVVVADQLIPQVLEGLRPRSRPRTRR
jgi:AcrR family transcriptional regulator